MFVLAIVAVAVHFKLVDVEPATHGEGAQAAEVHTWDDKVSMTLMGPFIPL